MDTNYNKDNLTKSLSKRIGRDWKQAKVWEKQYNQPWRTELEISTERQEQLNAWRKCPADYKNGLFPFKGKILHRDDIEWLLATHETHDQVRGPVEIGDQRLYPRKGIDLRGAIIRNKQGGAEDLHSLPLARMQGGLAWYERDDIEDSELTMEEKEELFQAAAVDMAGADLHETHLESTKLFRANLKNANLSGVYFDHITDLTEVVLGEPRLLNLRWGNANLSVIDWSLITCLGEERNGAEWARSKKSGLPHDHIFYKCGADLYRKAVQANRQVATVLQQQGLHEEAMNFGYRSQRLQRQVLRIQAKQKYHPHRFGKWLGYFFSWFLDILAGYGYRPRRTAFWYISIILGFSLIYYIIGFFVYPQMSLMGGLILSITSFHGRGFFPGLSSSLNENLLDNLIVQLSAIEGILGLFIEVSLIATFTQRYFGR